MFADIWVAFFQECQQWSCGQEGADAAELEALRGLAEQSNARADERGAKVGELQQELSAARERIEAAESGASEARAEAKAAEARAARFEAGLADAKDVMQVRLYSPYFGWLSSVPATDVAPTLALAPAPAAPFRLLSTDSACVLRLRPRLRLRLWLCLRL